MGTVRQRAADVEPEPEPKGAHWVCLACLGNREVLTLGYIAPPPVCAECGKPAERYYYARPWSFYE